MKTKIRRYGIALLTALAIAGCGGGGADGGGSPSVNASAGSSTGDPTAQGTPTAPTTPSTPTTPTTPTTPGSSDGSGPAAMVVALPADPGATTLNRLNGRGHASGVQTTASEAIQRPVTVSPVGVALASNANFFGGDEGNWSQLRAASSNNGGMMAGHGIVGGTHLAWLWDGTPAVRLSVPGGYSITAVVGPSDTGSLAATTYNPATAEQEVLLWQPNGSRSSIYKIVPVKAGIFLFGMAGNGWIGGVERDGILMTPKIYDGSWRALPIDAIACQCDAVRINTRGQVLMTPRDDSGRGYLVSAGGATLLPRPDPAARYADLNDLGDVVGTAAAGPFVILDGVVQELNAYAGSAALGWRFDTAVAINNQRQVLGVGQWQGQTRWYRLNLR